MSDQDENGASPLPTTWWDAQGPFSFALTTEGALTVEWWLRIAGGPPLRIGVVIPPEEVKTLRRGLQESETIQETLSARRPTRGAH
jgi:hypothetical protein